MSIRRARQEEPENSDRWVLSYADFITLLFAFFVVMYSISSVNEGKYKVLSESMVEAFRPLKKSVRPIEFDSRANQPQFSVIDFPDWMREIESFDDGDLEQLDNEVGEDEDPGDGPNDKQLENIASNLENTLTDFIGEGLVSVNRKDLWIEVEIKSNILFDSGMVDISPQAEPILIALAGAVSGLSNKIKVEGHTDNVPIVTDIYPSNWELSAARAVAVVQLLIRGGVFPERLAAVGLGEYQPIVSNYSESSRARNRRVVVIISKHDGVTEVEVEQSDQVSSSSSNTDEAVAVDSNQTLRPLKPKRLKGGGLLFSRETLVDPDQNQQ